MMFKRILIAVFFALTFKAQAQIPAANMPSFKFYKLNNNAPFLRKNIVAGKKSLIIFFDATCEHCQKTLYDFDRHVKELKHIKVYLVSMDQPKTIRLFLNKYCPRLILKNNVIVLRDIDNEFIKDFNPKKYPSIFLYSSQKKLLMYDDDENSVPIFLKILNAK